MYLLNNFQQQRLFGRHYGQVLSRYILENPYRPRMVDKSNPIFAYTVIEFHRRYRLNKRNFLCLFRILHKKLKGNQRQHSIPAINQLLIALRFYASGHFQYDDGDLIKCSQSSVCRIVKKISFIIAQSKAEFGIKLPNFTNVKRQFYERCGIPNVVGAIDCTLIKILRPASDDNSELYRSRKSFFAINVQAVATCDYKIYDLVVRWPGSTHDSRIFNNSTLKSKFVNSEIDGVLLGDSGYASLPYLFVPIPNPTTTAQTNYNRAQIRGRGCVERAFGIAKQRFRCLSIPLRTQ